MSKRHIAQSGKKQGQWVTCHANQQCRNGGVHVTTDQLEDAQQRIQDETGQKVSLSSIPLEAALDENVAIEERSRLLQAQVAAQQEAIRQQRAQLGEAQQEMAARVRFANHNQLLDTTGQVSDGISRLLTSRPDSEKRYQTVEEEAEGILALTENLDLHSDDQKHFTIVASLASQGVQRPAGQPAPADNLPEVVSNSLLKMVRLTAVIYQKSPTAERKQSYQQAVEGVLRYGAKMEDRQNRAAENLKMKASKSRKATLLKLIGW